MPDYLSRSLVDDADEDPDEISNLISKSTQTDFSIDHNYSPIVTAVETPAMKLRDPVSGDSTNTPKITPDSMSPSSSTQLPDSTV